jgi:hypothetical protein
MRRIANRAKSAIGIKRRLATSLQFYFYFGWKIKFELAQNALCTVNVFLVPTTTSSRKRREQIFARRFDGNGDIV